jgi:signal transduction histidine kinase
MEPRHDDADRRYRAFLRSRWPHRTLRLSQFALAGSPIMWCFDVAMPAPAAPSPGHMAMVRLPWMVLSLVGWLLARKAPGWRGLPAFAVLASVAWTWGNAWAYFALGLAGTAVQSTGLVICFLTAAVFLPITRAGRVGVFALMAAGHLALELIWPGAGPLGPRLVADAGVMVVVLVLVAIFENFAASQRRGLALRYRLERTVSELEASRARASAAVASVGRLAADVAHDVTNPLAAVKVNVAWLGEPADADGQAERAEVAMETLAAVERIHRIVADLRQQAAAHEEAAAREGAGRDGPARPRE